MAVKGITPDVSWSGVGVGSRHTLVTLLGIMGTATPGVSWGGGEMHTGQRFWEKWGDYIWNLPGQEADSCWGH